MDKLAIFDFDGLMVNSEEVVYAALCEMFDRYGHAFAWDYYCQTIGLPVVESIKMYLRDFPIGVPFDDFFAERNIVVARLLKTRLALMPGLPGLLDALRQSGTRMAVASSGTRVYVTGQLARFGIAEYFDAIVCIDDVRHGKPHPDLVLKALEVTGSPRKEAVMLEDAPHGVEAAHRAGVRCIAVPTQGIDFSQFARADAVVRDLDEARTILEAWDWIHPTPVA